ncbi:MAG: hypothetical protein WAL22_10785 [Solirubrobacteraceae bacterium]
MTQPPDLAHITHAELLTPFPQESLAFFVDLFGMEIEHQEGQSVFLRGWGEYQPYGLKLTESELPGVGHVGIRAWSPEALQRRVAAIQATGLGDAWVDGDHGHGPAYRFLSARHRYTVRRTSSRRGKQGRSACGNQRQRVELIRAPNPFQCRSSPDTRNH